MVRKTKKLYCGLGWPTIFTHIRFFTAPFEKLEKLVPKKGCIIDLGCGYGIFSNFLGLTGSKRKILGIEFDEKKIRVANRGVANVKFFRDDITKIKLVPADTILLIHVLHHLNSLADQEKLLKACRQKLKKSGQLIIAEVDRKPVGKYWLGWLVDHLLYPRDRIFYRFPAEFKKLFASLGFKVKLIRASQGKPFAHVIYLLSKR
ncbi:hypothetical protein COU97_01205 [Candidatus Shapirobacteria bacterium CG10_big_fil_rev_8_21_14_0_10_48_15]|uniref:Uncharacterized protein n=1 Tax=Candidatus Shapirobacteria bacterium CG10_big_fil_rev_8_21_14_0_10_48_15 TaxID=1974484 RepID=A0A2M8L7G2_9BACT|nr:MAG: hypothetical protein COU97_01205 [Candidatus Shapirobacteria bacterium CG10_big_fil_rev_8_21_14_0_10_48_15]